MIGPFPGEGPSDFRWYYLAAEHIVNGESPYLAIGYLYPPLTAFLFTPLAALKYVAGRRAWFILSHCFLAWAAWLVWRRLGGAWRTACVVAFVWASGGAAEESLALGQIGPLLTPVIAVAAFPGRLQAAAVGLGFTLKLVPGTLGLIFALRRRWRSLAIALVSAVLLIAIPWLALSLLTGPKKPQNIGFLAGTPTILSWSAPSIALRVRHPPGADGAPPARWLDNNIAAVHLDFGDRAVSLGVAGGVLILGLAALLWVTRGNVPDAAAPCVSAGLIALALVSLPLCWTHYELFQYPGAAILLDRALRDRRWLEGGAVLTSWLFLYQVPVTVLRAAYSAHGGWPHWPGYLYFWTSISAVASLCLFALALRAVRRPALKL